MILSFNLPLVDFEFGVSGDAVKEVAAVGVTVMLTAALALCVGEDLSVILFSTSFSITEQIKVY